MLERTIVVDQSAAFEDYRAAYRKHVFSRTNAGRLLRAPAILLALAIFYAVAAPNIYAFLPYYATLGVLIGISYLWAWFRGPGRAWKAYQEWGGLRYIFSDDGVSMTTGNGVLTMYPWSTVRRFVDADGVILLYFSKLQYGYVALRPLDPEVRADLRALIASKVPRSPKQLAS